MQLSFGFWDNMDKLKIEHHIQHLKDLHWKIDKDIELMERHGKYTDYEIEIKKKERLKLKDEIELSKRKMSEV